MMNIATLIHTNQVFSFSVQLAEFFVFLLVLRWYLATKRKRQQVSQASARPKDMLEQTVWVLLPTIGFATILFLMVSFFPPVLILCILFVLGLGIGGYWLVWRRKAP